MERSETKIGFVSLGIADFPGITRAKDIARSSIGLLESNGAIRVVSPKVPITEYELAVEASELFRRELVDGLVIQHGTFSLGYLTIEILKDLDVPIAVWGIPEPPLDGSPYTCGSMVGLLMHTSAMTNIGKKFSFIYGEPDDEKARNDAKRFASVVRTRAALRNTKIGLVGWRAPGFHVSNFDELAVKSIFGPEIIHVDLSEILAESDALPEEEVKKSVDEMVSSGFEIDNVPETTVLNAMSVYLGLKRIIESESLDAIAVKCWPEMRDRFGKGVCAVNSRLTDEGIMSSCEADLDGAMAMVVGYLLSGEVPFFCDWVQMDEQKNEILFWHCGNAPSKLASPKHKKYVRPFFTGADSIAVEFPLRTGRVTLSRLMSIRGKYKMLIAKGEAVETDLIMKGTCINVRFDSKTSDILAAILDNGFPHHYSLAYGDISDELRDLGKFWGIEVIEV